MKRKLQIGILSMAMALLSACGAEKDGGNGYVAPKVEPIGTEEATEQAAAPDHAEEAAGQATAPDRVEQAAGQASAPDDTEQAATPGEIYGEIVAEKEGDAYSFALIYLDGDDTPELVVCDRGYEAYSIYTVKEGQAFCMMDAMTTVELAYFEGTGVVCQFARWNGGGDEGGYCWYHYLLGDDKTLVDGDPATLHYTYDAIYDEEGNSTGEGTTKFYHMGQEVDEATYRQWMSDLGILEGNKKPYADIAMEKAEMLEILNWGKAGQGSGTGGAGEKEDPDGAKEAFGSVLGQLYETHTLPDGTDLGYDGILELSENKFALYDIDGDGEEELVVVWTTTYMAGMSEIIYGFDRETGKVRAELFEYPMVTFYDNGIVEVGVSHNHGLAGDMDFWPYTLYRYDGSADSYTVVAEVDAWNRVFREKDYNDQAFPEDIDADGDGVLYKLTIGGEEKLIDLEEYTKWRDSLLGGAQKVEIPFVGMTEENIHKFMGQ